MDSRSPDAEQTDKQQHAPAHAENSGVDAVAEVATDAGGAAEQGDVDRGASDDGAPTTSGAGSDSNVREQTDVAVSTEPDIAEADRSQADAVVSTEADIAEADRSQADATVSTEPDIAEADRSEGDDTASAGIERTREASAEGASAAIPSTPDTATQRRNRMLRGPRAPQRTAPAPADDPPGRPKASIRRVPRWAFLPFIALSTVHVIALAFHNDALAAPTKLGLMPLLAFAVLVGARGLRATAPIALLLAAILFSWLGDGAGVFVPFLPTLPMMRAFFGIAHLAYIALFWRHLRVRKFPLAAALLIVWWAAMVIVIAPAAKELAVAVAAYGIVLGLTAAFATRCSPMVLVGALFFLASDTILAFMLFLPSLTPPITDAAVMFTYTLGQGLIAAGALAALRRRQNSVTA